MSIYEIKILLAVYVGNEELVLKNAGGKKLADSNDYFVVTDDGNCHLQFSCREKATFFRCCHESAYF